MRWSQSIRAERGISSPSYSAKSDGPMGLSPAVKPTGISVNEKPGLSGIPSPAGFHAGAASPRAMAV